MTKSMGRVICGITISADGYSAGLNQTEERPFGDDGGDGWGDKLHACRRPRRTASRPDAPALGQGVPPLKLEQVKSRAARLVTHVTYRVLP